MSHKAANQLATGVSDADLILCYVDANYAFFTTQPLNIQWGDDWDDAPFEHNAGEPYEPCWHNDPVYRNDPRAKRGLKPGTLTPLDAGELCRCSTCKSDWNEDGTPKWQIVKVAWEGHLELPNAGQINSAWSVRDINAGAVAWLSTRCVNPPVVIAAGTSLAEFEKRVCQAGGKIFRNSAVVVETAKRSKLYEAAVAALQQYDCCNLVGESFAGLHSAMRTLREAIKEETV